MKEWKFFLLLLIPLVFLLAFFFVPLFNILRVSLTIEGWQDFISRTYLWRVLGFTVGQALLSTGLTLLVGLPASYLFARYEFAGKTLLRALITVPFVMPTVVVATAFRVLLGASSPLNQGLMWLFGLDVSPLQVEQGFALILLAHVFYNVSVVVRLVGGFWANLNHRLNEGAQSLGASPWHAFREITLPLLRPALFSAGMLVFLFTFSSFGVVLILGGPQYSTIETEIYRQYVTYLRADIAGILSLLQMIFTFLLMSVYAQWQRRTVVAINFRPQQAQLRRATGWREQMGLTLFLVVLFAFLVAPLLALVVRSVWSSEGGLTLAYYQALPALKRGSITFIPPLMAVRNSVGYALLTVVGAGVLGVLSAVWLSREGRGLSWVEGLFMLPLGASAVTLGFGYVVTYRQLRTSPLLVLIAHVLVALPFVVRAIMPALQGIEPRLREAAAVLGATSGQVWWAVDVPIMARAWLVGAVFAFTMSMGEFGATSFIVRPNSGYLTLPIAIYRYLGQPGALNLGQALAMSTILMVVCTVGFVTIERFRYADIGEF